MKAVGGEVIPMRCSRCGRRRRKVRTGRGPDGRLLFGWCDECLAEIQLHALGLRADDRPARPSLPGPGPSPVEEPAAPEDRALKLRSLGLLLVVWALLLQLLGAGSWLGLGAPDDGFGPTRVSRARLYTAAGALMAVMGAWVGLATLDRGTRRRTLARAVEATAVGLGLCLLAVGIVFHDPSRDPWVVAGVVLASAAALAARRWSRPRGPEARTLPSA